MHEVHVRGLPPWLGPAPLLGEGAWTVARSDVRVDWVAQLMTAEAADLEARLRRLVIAGHPVEVEVNPALRRTAQRRARLEDARRRRDTTAGFDRRECRYDEEGRWSLTPSSLALELGERAAGHPVLDLGCGVGGNTIGFARAGARVGAVERDPRRLGHARHNARVYGVEDRVEFVEGDAMSLLERYPGHLAFVDPPWGGEGRVSSVHDVVSVGEQVQVRVLAVETPASEGARPRIKLSMRTSAPSGGGKARGRGRPGKILEGTVTGVENYGVFIQTEMGQGMIPNRELDLPPGGDPRRTFPVGMEVRVAHLGKDPQDRLRFSIKQVGEIEARAEYEKVQSAAGASARKGMGSLGDLLQSRLGGLDLPASGGAAPADGAASPSPGTRHTVKK